MEKETPIKCGGQFLSTQTLGLGAECKVETLVAPPVNASTTRIESKLEDLMLVEQVQVHDGNGKTEAITNDVQHISSLVFPELVLQNVFQFLSIPDLLNCRLVSRGWWVEATDEMKKQALPWIRLSDSNGSKLRNPNKDEKSSLTRFNETMQSTNYLPAVSYSLTFERGVQEEETSQIIQELTKFYHICGNTIENLRIHPRDWSGTEWTWPEDPNFLDGYQMENLKNVEIDFSFTFSVSGVANACERDSVRSILRASPNIQSIIYSTRFRNTTCELLEAFKLYPPLHLNSLKIYIATMTEEMLNSLTHLNLRRLSLKMGFAESVRAQTMKEFLKTQSHCLEYLKLLPYNVNTKLYYDFPIMAKLKTMSIEFGHLCNNWSNRKIPVAGENYEPDLDIEIAVTQTIRFTVVDWPKCFPKLEELKIRNDIELHWRKALFSSESRVHHKLKLLAIPHSLLSSARPHIAQEICRIFPNIETLNAPWFNENTLGLCNMLPNLKTYVATTYPHLEDEVLQCTLRNEQVQCTSLKETLTNLFLEGQLPYMGMTEMTLENLTNFCFELSFKHPSGSENRVIRKIYDANWFPKLFVERREYEEYILRNFPTRPRQPDSDEEESDGVYYYRSDSD